MTKIVVKCPWGCTNGWNQIRRRDGTATGILTRCDACKGTGRKIIDAPTPPKDRTG